MAAEAFAFDDPFTAPRSPGSAAVERLVSASVEFKELAGMDWEGLGLEDPKAALKALELVTRAATAIQAGVLASVKSSGTWEKDGDRTLDTWVTSNTGTTRSTASRAVKLAESLQQDLPGTRKALADGEISSDHAQIISRRCASTDKQRERLADPLKGEAYLIRRAKEMDAGKFSKFAAGWSIEADPKAADRTWRKQTAKQELSLAPSDDGYYVKGWFDLVNGALLKEALSSHMGRKAKGDLRSFNERQADGLIALASQSLDSGIKMPNARVRPHLIITMGYDTIERLSHASGPIAPGEGAVDEGEWASAWKPGDDHVMSSALDYSLLGGVAPARLSDGNPIPHQVLSRLACNSLLSRVVFGANSVILNAGREERIFTPGQTRAIIARDVSCQYPGCDEGPGFGEIHHSISWAKHRGNTDVDLGILLCFHHHDLVHQRDITITRRGGEWIFTDQSGQVILPSGHRMPAPALASAAAGGPDPGGTQAPLWDQPGFDDGPAHFDDGPPPF